MRIGLTRGGLGELGVVSCAVFDRAAPPSLRSHRLLPGAACALVVGAGRELFRGLDLSGGDPLDRHTEAIVAGAVAGLEGLGHSARAVLAHTPAGDGHLDMVALGRAAGLGWPSRLGLLLHPERGPWWSLRAAILTNLALAPGAPRPGDGPCEGCPAPCAAACPARAPRPEGFSVQRCAEVRREPAPCATRCHARRACVAGPDHAYPVEAEAHVMRASRHALLQAAAVP